MWWQSFSHMGFFELAWNLCWHGPHFNTAGYVASAIIAEVAALSRR